MPRSRSLLGGRWSWRKTVKHVRDKERRKSKSGNPALQGFKPGRPPRPKQPTVPEEKHSVQQRHRKVGGAKCGGSWGPP